MRMHMTPPEITCMTHKNGEHGEIHKHRHTFVKQHSIKGRIEPEPQIEPLAMKKRHDELAKWLPNHNSPYEMPDLSYLSKKHLNAKVDVNASIRRLYNNCDECRKLIDASEYKTLMNKEVC